MKDQIVLRKLEQPVHAAETGYGLVLRREGSGYWLVQQRAYARSGGTTEYTERCFRIEKDFFAGANLETLARRIRKHTDMIWRYTECPDKTALIALMGRKRCY